MQPIAHYPIAHEAITPHIGRPVAVAAGDGDLVYGIVHNVHNGHLVLRPFDGAPGAFTNSFEKMKSDPQVKTAMKKMKTDQKQLRTSGFGGGYPYGWGYGNYGWGLGHWWIWPLLWTTALFAFPFFW